MRSPRRQTAVVPPADTSAAASRATGTAQITSGEFGEFMEEMSSSGTLPFRVGNSSAENKRLKLTTDSVDSISGQTAELPEEICCDNCSCSSCSSCGREEYETVTMEKVADGFILEDGGTQRSEDDDVLLPSEQSQESFCSLSFISDGSSIYSAAEDFPLLDAALEMGTPESVDSVNSVMSSTLKAASGCASGELGNSCVKLTPTVGQEAEEIQAYGASSNSPPLSELPLWGLVSICGRRPEMEDATAVVPQFLDFPLWMRSAAPLVDGGLNASLSHLAGHFFGVYDGHGGVQVLSLLKKREVRLFFYVISHFFMAPNYTGG